MFTVFFSIETRAQIGQKFAVSNIALDKKLSVLGEKLVSNLGGGSFQVLEVSQVFVGTASSIGAVASVAFSIVEVSIESVHCREEGCIGKYTPRGPRDFPRAGILHPEAREIARGRSPRAISRASGCKIPAQGNSRGPRGVYFPIHPDQ